MKKISWTTVLSVIICTFLFLSFFQTEESLPTNLEKKIIKIGADTSEKLMTALKTHLLQAMEGNDLGTAFEMCATVAYSLTEELQDSLPLGIKVKRTSFKYRNPENKPDPEEEKILRYFERELAKKNILPDYYIQYVKALDEFRYYKPMTTGELCLKCHGRTAVLDKAVVQSLIENYPEDRATGYALGDFRGAIRVAIPAEYLKDGPSF